MDKLKPCPFCGGVPELGESVLDSQAIFFILCRSCAAQGGSTHTRESAAGLWNRRDVKNKGKTRAPKPRPNHLKSP